MNFEELNVMLRAPKIILSEDNQAINDMTIDASFPIKRLRYTLGLLETVNNTRLMWQINQSEKMQIRLSLHIQQEETNIGLIRLDYNAGHRNPTEICPIFRLYFMTMQDLTLPTVPRTSISIQRTHHGTWYGRCR